MSMQDNAALALGLLAEADRKFANGEILKGSELMWKSTRAAVVAAAKLRHLPCDSDDDIAAAARLLAEECGDRLGLMRKFGLAEIFRHNAKEDILKDYEIGPCRESVAGLIESLLRQARTP